MDGIAMKCYFCQQAFGRIIQVHLSWQPLWKSNMSMTFNCNRCGKMLKSKNCREKSFFICDKAYSKIRDPENAIVNVFMSKHWRWLYIIPGWQKVFQLLLLSHCGYRCSQISNWKAISSLSSNVLLISKPD